LRAPQVLPVQQELLRAARRVLWRGVVETAARLDPLARRVPWAGPAAVVLPAHRAAEVVVASQVVAGAAVAAVAVAACPDLVGVVAAALVRPAPAGVEVVQAERPARRAGVARRE